MSDDPNAPLAAETSTTANQHAVGAVGNGGSVVPRGQSSNQLPQIRTPLPFSVQIVKVEGYAGDGNSSASPNAVVLDAEGRNLMIGQQQQQQQQSPLPHLAAAVTSTVVPSSAARKNKTSSFQITSVTVGTRLSNDGGDDSADDLDESHTDDLSSDMLDVSKTTDYECSSEDAFSSIRDDPQQTSGTRPTVPQGLKLFASSSPVVSNISPGYPSANSNNNNNANTSGGGNNNNNNNSGSGNVSVTVVEAPNVPMAVVQHPEIQWQNRFRVVKIESSEPFRRGRWLCMDFLDPPPAPPPQNTSAPAPATTETGQQHRESTGSGNNSSGAGSTAPGESSMVVEAAGSQHVTTSTWTLPEQPAPSISGVAAPATANTGNGPIYPVSIILQTQQQGGNLDFTNTALHMQQQNQQQQQHQMQQQQQLHTQQPCTPNIQDYLHQQHQAAQQAQMDYSQQHQQQMAASLGHPPSGQQPHHPANMTSNMAPGASLPVVGSTTTTNDYVNTSVQPQQQQQQQHMDYTTASAAVAPQQMQQQQQASEQAQALVNVQQQQQQQHQQQNQMQAEYVAQQDYAAVQSHLYQQQMSAEYHQQQEQQQQQQQQQNYGQPTNGGGGGVATGGGQTYEYAAVSQQLQTNESSQTDGGAQVNASLSLPGGGAAGSETSGGGAGAAAGATSPPCGSVPQTSEGAVAAASGEEGDAESASGASTVAIDNKIEQAMDLVKSHLMFAVREEVDVLKEKITELMDRINQLEYENSVLKAGASPETLAKLSSSSSNNPAS